MTATESWLETVYRMEGGGGEGCSQTGVQQQKLKQNWLVVSVTVLCWLVAKLL